MLCLTILLEYCEGVDKHMNSGLCGFPKGFQNGSHEWCLKKFREKIPIWIKSWYKTGQRMGVDGQFLQWSYKTPMLGLGLFDLFMKDE